MKLNDQGLITALDDNEIFVFGSNIKGAHAGGAARQAFDNFGAVWDIGEGLMNDCYAFPTLDENMQRYDYETLISIREAFYRCVNAHPELTFLLTPVGTGIAGFSMGYMEALFSKTPSNVRKVGWNEALKHIGETAQ